MANPNPSPETRFQKGQSGNPGGRPKRPDIDALNETIEKHGAEPGLALAWLAQALGDKKAGIKPDFAFFKLLIEYRNGKVPDQVNVTTNQDAEDERDFLDHAQATKTKKPKAKKAQPKPGAADDR